MAPLALFLATLACTAGAEKTSPVAKVIQLLTDLSFKVAKEGEEARKTFEAFSEWCEERSKNIKYDVATGKAEVEELKATIEKAESTISALTAEVENTAASISKNEADLKAATEIRKTEEADFAASSAELTDVIGSLERAIGILEREARKGGAAMLQVNKANSVVEALRAMVEASMLNSQDAAKLTALVQSNQASTDDGDSFGAPDPAAYESHSGSIISTLEGLLDKAKDQLESARKAETSAKHNFELLKQSLDDEIKFGNQELDKAKKGLMEQTEGKATAEGDLGTTSKTLAEDEKTMGTLKQDCFEQVQDYDAEKKSREEELKALAEAKRVIIEQTGGAADITYSLRQTALLQLAKLDRIGLWTGIDLANFEAVRFVRNLAREQHSDALMQLARRMAAAMRYGTASGEDPFAKVKGLIKGMLETLEADATADATHKAYCDKEMGETLAKKADKEAQIDKLATSIDTMTAKSTQLKDEVASIQKALAELYKSQADLTSLRQVEKEQYLKNKPEMEQGLEGVKMALKMLREYYANTEDQAHTAATGSATGIIGLLEVVESDFSKTLAEMMATEATAQADYDHETNENQIEKATKEADVKYKEKEHKQLDAAVAEATSDLDGVHTELSAILEYNKRILEMCVAKPEGYEERSRRREAEIAGLKEALSILEGEAVLIQRRKAGALRGRGPLRSGRRPAAVAPHQPRGA